MASARSPSQSSEDIVYTTPFLGGGDSSSSFSATAAVDGSSVSSPRVMREPLMLVSESAAEQLEERQSEWAYSKPVIVLDVLWNFAFIIAAATVLVLSRDESLDTPLQLCIVGYALQCVLQATVPRGCVL